MKGIILAAGRGRRMGNLTEDNPKCLLKFKGKPLIEWQILAMKKAGILEIGIVTGYKKELLEQYGLHCFHNPEWEKTQMVESLFCAEVWLRSTTCIVSYSDIFYTPKAIVSLKNSLGPIAITYDKNWLQLWTKRFKKPLDDAETFKIDTNGKVLEIGNKTNDPSEIMGQYMGLLKLSPESWPEMNQIRSALSKSENQSLQMTQLLQKIIHKKALNVTGVAYSQKWYEIDSAQDLVYGNN